MYDSASRSARSRGMEGEVVVRLRIGAGGGVEFFEVARSSGYAMLDQAALEMVQRADPFPPLPPSQVNERMEYVIPVVFALR
jgi:periplasmic protein TonB